MNQALYAHMNNKRQKKKEYHQQQMLARCMEKGTLVLLVAM
jgi:hypothetical protein